VQTQRDATTPTSQRSDREASEPTEDYDSADDDLALDDQTEESGLPAEKSLHRTIPSWFEAVNVVVSANLESRAKTPDRKSGGHPRGGHDRRGRDRAGGKPN
jgi:hypothetical protein